MATVATTTQSDALSPPGSAAIAVDRTTGYLYSLVRTGADTLTLYRSTDSGGSWSSYAAFTHTGLQEWGSIVADGAGWVHLAYRISASSADSVWYRRCSLASAAWSSGLQSSGSDPNGGVAGAIVQGVDLAVVRHPDGAYAIAVVAAYTRNSVPSYGVWVTAVSITNAGVVYANDPLIVGNRAFFTVGTAAGGRMDVTCDIEHVGDGVTGSTPHLWVSWGRTTLHMVKLAWQGKDWSGPANFQTIRTGLPAMDYAAGRWDGAQWLMGVISPDSSSVVRVYQRNAANTATTVIDTPTHPTGVIRNLAVSYDAVSRNLRVFAVGTSTAVLYYVDYVRATSTWTAWATVTATAVLGPAEWSTRRGGTSTTNRYDVLTTASGSPNTVSHTALTAPSAPSIPTWDTSAQPYLHGGAANVSASLTLDWIFSDPDPGQAQGSYAVSRQIGAGALAYWRASDSTWQATEQQNASASTALTLSSGWGADADAAHTYKVKVWDAGNIPSAGYSAGLTLIPSALVNPSITAPTAAQVLTTDTVTVTWTVSQQTQRRVRLLTNPGGVVVHDSGFETTSSTSYTVPYSMANGTGWTVEVTTRNNEGLASTAQTRNFTISYTPPPAVTSTLTPVPASGWMAVVSTNPTPSGGQPAITSMDLYRRPVGSTDTGVRVATGKQPPATVNDWQAASGISYEYRWIVYGANGTSVTSSWTS